MEQIGRGVHRVRAVSLIDEGRWGEVFVGLDEVLRRRVVVKRLASASFEKPGARQRLIEEARILSRLDHPNVLRIHDYSERGGYDVFTFEFAPGTKLPEALEEGRLDFAKKVRIATAVASALVVAHRNGIVHGALSPASVILADNGEIKVADFSSTSTQLDGRRADPRWQSPQEKLGDEPSRAGDMYAFGLFLRELFGDKDRDVRAIVNSLVRDVPSERATAAVTLAGLNRLGRRQSRRIRLAAIILVAAVFIGGGIKYALDLQRERREALEMKAEADARRVEATKLLSFFIRDLRPKLGSVGRLDIMDAATAKALEYFASTNPAEISPSEAAVHVEALAVLGQNQLARSNVPAALESFRRAVSLGETTMRRAPDNLELRYGVAFAHAWTSRALDQVGDLAGALRHSQACAATSADLVRLEPRNVRFLLQEAYAHSNLGSIHDRREEIEPSLREFETAVALKRQLLLLENTHVMQVDLGVTVNKLAMALFKAGRFRSAQTMLDEERVHLESMLARQNRDMAAREVLARCDDSLVTVAFAMGDLASASRHAANQVATTRELVLFEPNNVDWARQMVAAYRNSGTAARVRGDFAGALKDHAAAITALSGAVEGDRRTTTLTRDMAMARVDHARSLLAAGKSAAAEEEAHHAVEDLVRMENDLPARRTLGEALLVQGEALAARGNRAAAATSWEESLRIVEPLDALSSDPRIADLHARLLLRLDRAEGARPLIDRLLAIGYHHPEFESLIRERIPNAAQQP